MAHNKKGLRAGGGGHKWAEYLRGKEEASDGFQPRSQRRSKPKVPIEGWLGTKLGSH
jgi:hypothetical protein